ncbi:MAG: hypothetical protein AAGN64_11640, partial [Bacteroidota bacterium]
MSTILQEKPAIAAPAKPAQKQNRSGMDYTQRSDFSADNSCYGGPHFLVHSQFPRGNCEWTRKWGPP